MTIIQKSDNENTSIVLDNIAEIFKGETLFTSCNSYNGWAVLNFRTTDGKLIQWDYGRISEENNKARDEQYNQITNSK